MRTCPVDGVPVTGRADRLYCSERCSKKARRAQKSGAVSAPVVSLHAPSAGLPSLVESVRSELRKADAEASGLGVSALLLAAQIDARQDAGSAMAALNRELRATLAEATRGQAKSAITAYRDELAERRARA